MEDKGWTEVRAMSNYKLQHKWVSRAINADNCRCLHVFSSVESKVQIGCVRLFSVRYTLRNVGGGWVKKVTMNHEKCHLYCCSETDLYAYNLDTGDEIFTISRWGIGQSTWPLLSAHVDVERCVLFNMYRRHWVIPWETVLACRIGWLWVAKHNSPVLNASQSIIH